MLRSRAVLIVFAVVSVGNLVAVGIRNDALEWATKPLLMPLLGIWLWLVTRERDGRPSRLVLAGLALSTGGDIALLSPGTGWFLTGMSLFLGAQLCYLTAFLRAPARSGAGRASAALRRLPLVTVPLGYAIVGTAVLTWLWPGLTELGVAIPVAAYATALATMATSAAALGWRMGLGGAIFLGSDLMIAIGMTDAATLPGPPIWVMTTYLAAQALLITGWAARSAHRPA
ncbi:lysoplasmalogenase [Micromonospora sp. NPDC003197]